MLYRDAPAEYRSKKGYYYKNVKDADNYIAYSVILEASARKRNCSNSNS